MILDQYGRPIPQARADSWANPITGYGGSDDNIENTLYYQDPIVGEWQANWMYENSGVVSRGIEAPVKDRLSKGVDFLTNDDDSEGRKKEIEAVENDIKAAKVWDKYIEGSIWSRLHGGGLLYFDYGDDRKFETLQHPINFELRDPQRGIPNKIWVLDRWQAIPQSYYTPAVHGPDHPKLGEVEVYSLNLHTTGFAKLVYAHESRCIKIDGLPWSNRTRAANLMWGNSILTRVYKVARFLGVSLKSMTDILEDWNYKSVGIPNLADKLISNKPEDIQEMFKRVGMAAKNSHNQTASMHDADGGMMTHSTTATGINEVVGLLVNFFCGELGIPYSRLFSAEGGALAGTAAETDIKNYHESLRYDQNHRDRPAVERIIWL
ncbi:MAG: anti-CBASS protein Acb1 family protein, partial [Planctomycetota bacterium]